MLHYEHAQRSRQLKRSSLELFLPLNLLCASSRIGEFVCRCQKRCFLDRKMTAQTDCRSVVVGKIQSAILRGCSAAISGFSKLYARRVASRKHGIGSCKVRTHHASLYASSLLQSVEREQRMFVEATRRRALLCYKIKFRFVTKAA